MEDKWGCPMTQYLGHSMQRKALNHGMGHTRYGFTVTLVPYKYSWTKVKAIITDKNGFTHPDYGGSFAYYMGGIAPPNYPVPSTIAGVVGNGNIVSILGVSQDNEWSYPLLEVWVK